VVIIADEQGVLFCRQWPLEVPSLMISANEYNRKCSDKQAHK